MYKYSVFETITGKTLAVFSDYYSAERFLQAAKKAHGGYIYRIIIEKEV